MKSSQSPTTPKAKPRFSCYGCKRKLELDGLRRIWPAEPEPYGHRHKSKQHLVTEIACVHCH